MKDREATIEQMRDDFAQLDDGMYYLFPKRSGGYASYLLRWVADELDRLNEPLQKEIEQYFSEEGMKNCKYWTDAEKCEYCIISPDDQLQWRSCHSVVTYLTYRFMVIVGMVVAFLVGLILGIKI